MVNRLVPLAVVIALLLPAGALAGTRYRCLYTGETSDHCKAAEARSEPASGAPAVERVCCETLASSFVEAPARVESASQVGAAVADVPAVPAPRARPPALVRSPAVVARAGPTSGRAPEFLLHCSLQL